MSVYRCEQCENYIDSDYEGCYLHPEDNCSLICEPCHKEIAGSEYE